MTRDGQTASSRSTGERTPEARGNRVLLVARNQALLLAVRTALGTIGFQVTAVKSVDEALTVLMRSEGSFGLLVLDLDPATSIRGEGLVAMIWRLSPQTRVLLLSSLRVEIETALAQRENVRVLPKPFRIDELEGVCREFLRG